MPIPRGFREVRPLEWRGRKRNRIYGQSLALLERPINAEGGGLHPKGC